MMADNRKNVGAAAEREGAGRLIVRADEMLLAFLKVEADESDRARPKALAVSSFGVRAIIVKDLRCVF